MTVFGLKGQPAQKELKSILDPLVERLNEFQGDVVSFFDNFAEEGSIYDAFCKKYKNHEFYPSLMRCTEERDITRQIVIELVEQEISRKFVNAESLGFNQHLLGVIPQGAE